jgi:hypothetical protein
MPHSPERDGGEGLGARPGDELSARLLGRGASVGVVNVGWVQRQYARTADWMAERFAVLGDLNARYGTVDSRAADSAAPLPIARGHYVPAESETPPRDDDYTPGGGGLERAVEVSAPHAGEAGGGMGAQGGGSGPTLQRKSKGPEQAPAPPEKSAPPEKPAPLVSQESAHESAAPPTLMRLAAESPAAESPSPTTGSDLSAAELTLETPHAHALRESSGDAPSVPDARPPAREAVPSVSAKQETTIQPTFAREPGRAEENASAETATSSEQQSLPLAREEGPRASSQSEEGPRASSQSAATIMRAARGAESATPIQRAAESAMLIQRAAVREEDAPTSSAVETTFAASASTSPSNAEHATVGHATVGHATGRATAHAAEVRAQPRLSAPEILRSPSPPLTARMVWRKSVGGASVTSGTPDAARAELPYVTPVPPSPSAANTQMLYRAEAPAPALARAASDGEGGESAAPVASAQSSAGGLSLEQITEYVSRVILRRIAVERERRGARRWL